MRLSARYALSACLAVLPVGAQLLDENTDLAVPLTAQGKAARTLRIASGPGPLISSNVGAAFDQLDNEPSEWGQGMKGYGHRFISSYGGYVIGATIKTSLDVALKTDPRYDRCDCSGAGPRVAHAIKRVFVTRKDSGGEMVNLPLLAAAIGSATISHQWYPDRLNTAGHHFKGAGTSLGVSCGMNVAREFWPDIKKKIRFRK
jgi:hypothetical protein